MAGPLGDVRAQPITYQDILERPDDPALSLAYARQEIAAGNLEQGAAALERLLLNEPNWDVVRLYYAIVLYRLDDLSGAKRELMLLQERPLSPAHRAEARRYLSLVLSGKRKLRLSALISTGLVLADNPAFASSASFGLTGGVLAPIATNRETDVAAVAGLQVRAERSIESGRGDFLFADVRGWMNEQFEVDVADYLSGRARAGATFHLRDLSLTPYGHFSTYHLDGEFHYHELGGGLRAQYAVSPKVIFLAELQAFWQDFEPTDLSPIGGARDGLLLSIGGGITLRPAEWFSLTFRANYLDKDADSDAFSYQGVQLSAHQLLLLGQGQYISAAFTYWHIDYADPDLRVSPTIVREDERYRVQVAYGLPLSTAFSVFDVTLPDAVGQMNFQVGGQYYAQDSNLPNFRSDNWSGDVKLSRRIDF